MSATKGVVVVLFVLKLITNVKEVSVKLGSMKSVCMYNTKSWNCDLYSVCTYIRTYYVYYCTVILA